MTPDKLKQLLRQGEGIDIEFKTAHFELNKDTFDSICAFLNRKGGHLLLGVTNKGQIEGILESAIPVMTNNIITCANNPGKLDPPCDLCPQIVNFEGRKLIYVYVPESKFVHSHAGRIFDRSGDADLDVTRLPYAVQNMHVRKHDAHMEDRVFPYVELADLNTSLFKGIRIMAETRQTNHPWTTMSNEGLIRSAGLYKTDPATGKSGITLAGVLLLGKEVTILNCLPQHKTDAILRVENLDRYDDRDVIHCNLIESFDRLMSFITKHLPDKFYLDGVQTVSLRHRLFREVVSNLLIHRAFTDGFPAKLIIQHDQVYTENWCHPNRWGSIDPANFVPFSRNPAIARFFREIGQADELGSGVRKIFRDSPVYTPGAIPQLIEGDVFKQIIPIRPIDFNRNAREGGWEEVRIKVRNKFVLKFGEPLPDHLDKSLKLIYQQPSITANAIAKAIGISPRAVQKQMATLKYAGIILRSGSKKIGYWKINID